MTSTAADSPPLPSSTTTGGLLRVSEPDVWTPPHFPHVWLLPPSHPPSPASLAADPIATLQVQITLKTVQADDDDGAGSGGSALTRTVS
ncbi:hypothetical protein E2C01_025656 [Portunus trituberculatus]|uniref:Uncharacterized protein n=1 Tax=Portunus trituberculatus TaxID=210409 RepID=A0A5B7EGI2_PORTR|nr:hypothetical protein [Portunus trituberculatus]